MAFAWLVLKASWRDTTVRYKDRIIQLKRGQLAVSLRDFAIKLDRTKQWAERFLDRLQKCDMIGTVAVTGVTVITICNYDEFQRPWDTAETATETGPGQDRDRTGTQNNEVKSGNERKEVKNKSSFVLPDWVSPEAWAEWEAHRREIKAPLTDTSRAKCVKVLEEATRAGYSTEETIQQSIVSGWRGLFVPKGKPKPKLGDMPDYLRDVMISEAAAERRRREREARV